MTPYHSWQAETYQLLRDRGPVDLGSIFNEIVDKIPIHHATRFVESTRRNRTDLSPAALRWAKFRQAVCQIKVDAEPKGARLLLGSIVTVRPVGTCERCGSPLYRKGWASRAAEKCVCYETLTRPEQIANAYEAIARINHHMVGIVAPCTLEERKAAKHILMCRQNKITRNGPYHKRLSLALDLIEQTLKTLR